MASYIALNIIKDNLVLYLDAANSLSYPRSGTTWSDLSGNGNHLTLVNSPSFSTNGNGCIIFNGTNNYGTFANNPLYTAYSSDLANQKWTIECWFNISNTGTRQPLLGEYVLGQLGYGIYLGFVDSQRLPIMYTDPTYYLYGATTVANSTNKHITYVFDGSNTQRNQYIYINGVLSNSTLRTVSATYPALSNTLTMGKSDTSYLNGSLYVLKMYTKALKSTEIQQNYNALKSRFGL
jgi:hypothetical protein